MTEYWGNYSYTLEKKLQTQVESREPESEGRAVWEVRKQKQALEKRKEKDIKLKERRIAELEREIEGLEDELKAAEEKLASPAVYEDFNQVSDITRWYNELKTKRDGLYDLLEKEVS